MPSERAGIETLLLAIGWQGPWAVTLDHRESLRRFYREDWPAWMEIKTKLQAGGMPLHEIMGVVVDEHPAACACWDCVLALQSEIYRAGVLFGRSQS